MIGSLDRPGGALHFEVIDATPRWHGAIGAPTLLLAPAQSPFVPLAVMEEMHAVIPGSELAVFADARHGLPCSHGTAAGRALRAFLDRRVAAPA